MHIPRKDGRAAKQGGACGKDLLGLCPICVASGGESLSNASVLPQLDPSLPCPSKPKPKVLFFFLSLPFPFVLSLPRTGPGPGPSLCSPKCPLLTLSASSGVSFCLPWVFSFSHPVWPGWQFFLISFCSFKFLPLLSAHLSQKVPPFHALSSPITVAFSLFNSCPTALRPRAHLPLSAHGAYACWK